MTAIWLKKLAKQQKWHSIMITEHYLLFYLSSDSLKRHTAGEENNPPLFKG